MAKFKQIVVIAPYWCDPQHLGHYRVERFIRWLSESGVSLVVVAAADNESCEEMAWGKLITLRDPLKIYGDRRNQHAPQHSASMPVPKKAAVKRPGWLRWLAYALLSPDPGILWARRAAKHPVVLEHAGKADAVLSSSFPESVHVAASRLAAQFKLPLLVDMRDGWLDEPMKPILTTSAIRRWQESLLEQRILRQASLITVTSDQWRQMLTKRLPHTDAKTVAITNAYPQKCGLMPAEQRPLHRRLNLLYAGRIFTSRAERRLEHLLQPLLIGLKASGAEGSLNFVGDLAQTELDGLQAWRSSFLQAGWDIQIRSSVPRQEALERMREADGLILLSSSHASIPAKLFDYLCVQRPILAIAPIGSAVAELDRQLPQLFVTGYQAMDASPEIISHFIDACRCGEVYELPSQFGDEHTRRLFLEAMDSVTKTTI